MSVRIAAPPASPAAISPRYMPASEYCPPNMSRTMAGTTEMMMPAPAQNTVASRMICSTRRCWRTYRKPCATGVHTPAGIACGTARERDIAMPTSSSALAMNVSASR